MTSVRISGAVLAGGKSTRMGSDKGSLCLNGETLLARQMRLLTEAGCEELLVSVAGSTTARPAVPETARLLADRFPESGPLAGIERILAEARHDLVLVVAVDLPELSSDFLRTLVARAEVGIGVVPRRGGRFEPLVAVYPRAARAEAVARLTRRELALQPFVRAGLIAGWLHDYAVTAAEERFFTNWNGPEDFTAPCGRA